MYIDQIQSSLPAPARPEIPRVARILVVDDDQLVCGLHALVLERQGYEVVTAENGADALNQLSWGEFDLVITDRQMPILDGASLVQALRSSGSRIPVIMISSSLATSPLPAAISRELAAALMKPARPSEVLDATARALRWRKMEDNAGLLLEAAVSETLF